jgi:hypothetical protein
MYSMQCCGTQQFAELWFYAKWSSGTTTTTSRRRQQQQQYRSILTSHDNKQARTMNKGQRWTSATRTTLPCQQADKDDWAPWSVAGLTLNEWISHKTLEIQLRAATIERHGPPLSTINKKRRKGHRLPSGLCQIDFMSRKVKYWNSEVFYKGTWLLCVPRSPYHQQSLHVGKLTRKPIIVLLVYSR